MIAVHCLLALNGNVNFHHLIYLVQLALDVFVGLVSFHCVLNWEGYDQWDIPIPPFYERCTTCSWAV